METLFENPVFTGGFSLMMIGGFLAYIHSIILSFIGLFIQQFVLSIEISSSEGIFYGHSF